MFKGKWHIQEMSEWDAEYFNEEVQAFIEVEARGRGQFQFGYVIGFMDGKVVDYPEGRRFEFTWDGNDENDPANGCGWFWKKSIDQIEGEIRLHNGDDSTFSAVLAK